MRVRVGIACASLWGLLFACSACTGPGLEPPGHGAADRARGEPKYDGTDLGEGSSSEDAAGDEDLDAGAETEHTNLDDAAR